jgi:hypothetical protein
VVVVKVLDIQKVVVQQMVDLVDLVEAVHIIQVLEVLVLQIKVLQEEILVGFQVEAVAELVPLDQLVVILVVMEEMV